MPEETWRVLVADMIEHARLAAEHAEGLDRAEFLDDLKTIHAVTRCIEIIGEAARGVPDDVRQRAPDVPWTQIVGTRNILAHNYSRVDAELLWRLIESDFDQLSKKLQPLLGATN